MRLCPTLPGDDRALISHSICATACMDRQREFYHKCHRCMYRGKPANFEIPKLQPTESNAPDESRSANASD